MHGGHHHGGGGRWPSPAFWPQYDPGPSTIIVTPPAPAAVSPTVDVKSNNLLLGALAGAVVVLLLRKG